MHGDSSPLLSSPHATTTTTTNTITTPSRRRPSKCRYTNSHTSFTVYRVDMQTEKKKKRYLGIVEWSTTRNRNNVLLNNVLVCSYIAGGCADPRL
ncbi:hypothetical protein E2C01_042470 [Portunus trituberculatus]|uniref:Uncharacterized protein n=1 Tax=Portunus trituberculatus TaxID=210409 RepID=A0A5B7FUW2_PORTR|nr:hypothetical protein [Portunus trituberculatus]